MTTAFLSHKSHHAFAAQALVSALSILLPPNEIFRAEEIEKGEDWRANIDQALRDAKCFILLYSDPQLDWSWCFYEAGAFAKMSTASERLVFCIHPADVEPPSPLANLQTISATPEQLEKWMRNDLCKIVGCQQPSANVISPSIKQMVKMFNDLSPVNEKVLKPFIWIEPTWPQPGNAPDWNDANAIEDVNFSDAAVSIDAVSATQLGFVSPPERSQLLPFLREIACDAEWSDDRLSFWIATFFKSLREAAKGRLLYQEAAYFRHESGSILRPVVVSFAKNSSGTTCRLRVIFASAFGSPLTDHPTPVQRLSDGIRLAVRTRLEILNPFLGRMSQVHRDKILSTRPRDAIARRNLVGSRVVEALDTIWQEALAHGMRPDSPPPSLFGEPAQKEYEELRNGALALWEELREKALEEDQKRTGDYPESERLLGELNNSVQAYLALSLPRLQELLT
jgi:hypothetical protein